jgi:hypothetical protein
METNFTPWNDALEIEGDARESVMEQHAESSFEENLTTPEDVAEYEEWLDGGEMDGDHGSALESVYGPND